MFSSELAAVRRHLCASRRQHLRHVAQVGGERQQGDHAEEDQEDAAFGQNQEGADVVPVPDVLHLLVLVLLHQVAVLVPLRGLERIVLIHLRSGGEKSKNKTAVTEISIQRTGKLGVKYGKESGFIKRISFQNKATVSNDQKDEHKIRKNF